jgi:hydroxymethylpyrimidine/phosphomethylpyrimidine kinase
VRVALSIAGSDPTGGAGLQLDLQVFRALGVHGAGVPTALTVQDTAKVHRILPAFPNVVLEQIRALVRDVVPHAVKLGMLATDDVARMVELGIAELYRDGAGRPPAPRPPLVIDPVLAASDGTPLLERRALDALAQLVGLARVVTPNLPEAAALTGRDVSTAGGIEEAARDFVGELGAQAALVKGGHREGPPDDLLAERDGDGVRLSWLRGVRIAHAGGPARVHGTGCALSSAIAAGLARGLALAPAVEEARAFVRRAIERAAVLGVREGAARVLVFP